MNLYISREDLIEKRGWTEDILQTHLPDSDKKKGETDDYLIIQILRLEKKIGMDQFKFLTQSAIARRKGWTKSMVNEFLGEPDRTKTNFKYKSAPPLKLYSITRITEAELTEKFKKRSEKAQIRSQSMKKSAERRKNELLQKIEDEEIKVPKLYPRHLKRNSLDHYNAHWLSRGCFEKFATGKESKSFLHRINVNYLRHEVSDYEYRLMDVYSKIGAEEARLLIKIKVLEAIGRAYHKLKPECNRQIEQAKEEHEMRMAYRQLAY